MNSANLYVGALLVAMFVAGIVMIVRWRRQRSKTREQWSKARRP